MFSRIFEKSQNRSRKELLKLVIKHGLDTKFRNKLGQNLLYQFLDQHVPVNNYYYAHTNVYNDDIEIAEVLINSGVPVDESFDPTKSPLYLSILTRNICYTSLFIQRGADLNVKSNEGYTPLFLAIQCDCTDIVDLLLSNGADVNIKSNKGDTPLTFAIKYSRSMDIVKLLLNRVDVNAKTNIGRTALHLACCYRQKELFRLLIQKGADLSIQDNNGWTPLSLKFLTLPPHSNISLEIYNQFTNVVVKELSKLRFESLPISEYDLYLIQDNSIIQDHFLKYGDELHQMSNTTFNAPYSYYSVLKMSVNIKKLAHFTKNKELVLKFEENLPKFVYYGEDLRKIWKEAIEIRNIKEVIGFR